MSALCPLCTTQTRSFIKRFLLISFSGLQPIIFHCTTSQQSDVEEFGSLCRLLLARAAWMPNYSPGAAGPRGSPVPPQWEQTSLYCSSLQQLSWQPESYPGWGKSKQKDTYLTVRTLFHNSGLEHNSSLLLYWSTQLTIILFYFVWNMLCYCSSNPLEFILLQPR